MAMELANGHGEQSFRFAGDLGDCGIDIDNTVGFGIVVLKFDSEGNVTECR